MERRRGWSRRHDLDRAQAAALADLAALRAPAHVYAHPAHGLELGSFGPAVWPVLERAVAAGTVLVPVGGPGQVEVAPAPATVRIDVVLDDDGCHLVAAVGVVGVQHRETEGDREERTWTGEDVMVLGARAHGVVLLDRGHGHREDPGGQPPYPVQRLLLARLEGPVDPGVRRLLESPARLTVPAASGPELLGDYLPRLRRHVVVGSSDGSVELPADVPPRLRLTLDWTAPGIVGWTGGGA